MSAVLEVEGLTIRLRPAGLAPVVDDVRFSVAGGETLGIVGESGSGKTMLALSVMGLLPASMTWSARHIRLLGRDLDPASAGDWRRYRGRDMAMIFQEPMTALNPVMRVGDQIREVLSWRAGLRGRAAERQVIDLLEQVEIPSAAERARAFPHELSGGMRQRVMIAIALAGKPKLLIADEPTTALDVTIQAQILELLRKLRRDMALAMILITHDLGVIAELADRVMVVYAGRAVETAPVSGLFDEARHPYTQALLSSAPSTTGQRRRLTAIPGSIPAAGTILPGCRFAPRCPDRAGVCEAGALDLAAVSAHHAVACLKPFGFRRADHAQAMPP